MNLGTGVGYSVMDVVKGMEDACGKPIPYKVRKAKGAHQAGAKRSAVYGVVSAPSGLCLFSWRGRTPRFVLFCSQPQPWYSLHAVLFFLFVFFSLIEFYEFCFVLPTRTCLTPLGL